MMNSSKKRFTAILCLILLVVFSAISVFAEDGDGEEPTDEPNPPVTDTTEKPQPTKKPTVAPTHAPTSKPHTTERRTTTTEAPATQPRSTESIYTTAATSDYTQPTGETTTEITTEFTSEPTEATEAEEKKDYTIDLKKTEKSLNGEFGYFGPFTSDDSVATSSKNGLIFNTKIKDGYVSFDFDPSLCSPTYKYLILTLRSSDDSVKPSFTLTVGNITKEFSEWILEDGSKPTKAIPQGFTDYVIDLDANGVTGLLQDGYDFVIKNDTQGNELITIMGMIFSDDNPMSGKTKAKKSSLIKAIILPIILIVISVGVLIYVNFVLFKRKKYEDSRVRGAKKEPTPRRSPPPSKGRRR